MGFDWCTACSTRTVRWASSLGLTGVQRVPLGRLGGPVRGDGLVYSVFHWGGKEGQFVGSDWCMACSTRADRRASSLGLTGVQRVP